MQRLILVFLAVLSFTSFNISVGQIRPGKPSHAEDRVIIQRRRIVLVRNADVVKRFPDRRTAVVTYPVIMGLSNPAVLRKVRLALQFKNIFDYSLKEYREDPWLTEFNYLVNYNRNYFLDITFTQSGLAAYPDEQQKHFLISLKDGHIVTAQDVFESNKLNALAEIVDRELQREIKRIAHKNRSPEEKEMVNGAYDSLKFELKELDGFSIGPKGITFLYDAGFPHVIKTLEPQGKYFFTYSELKPYIKRDGLLGQFVD
jgi:hypothetical protein